MDFLSKISDRLPSFTHLFALHKGTVLHESVTTKKKKKGKKSKEKLKTLDSAGVLILYHSIAQQILFSNNTRHSFGFFTCEIEVMTTVLAIQSCCNKIWQTRWPKQQNCISHSSGSWKLTVLAGLASPETSPWLMNGCLLTSFHTASSLRTHILSVSSFSYDTSPVGRGRHLYDLILILIISLMVLHPNAVTFGVKISTYKSWGTKFCIQQNILRAINYTYIAQLKPINAQESLATLCNYSPAKIFITLIII